MPQIGVEKGVRAVLYLGPEPGLDQVANDASTVDEEANVHDRIWAIAHHRRNLGVERGGGRIVEDGLGLGADLAEQRGHETRDRDPILIGPADKRDAGRAVAGNDVGDDGGDRLHGRHRAEEIGGVLLCAEGRGLRRGRALRSFRVVERLDDGLCDARSGRPEDHVGALRQQAVDPFDGDIRACRGVCIDDADVAAGGVDVLHGKERGFNSGTGERGERSRFRDQPADLERYDHRFGFRRGFGLRRRLGCRRGLRCGLRLGRRFRLRRRCGIGCRRGLGRGGQLDRCGRWLYLAVPLSAAAGRDEEQSENSDRDEQRPYRGPDARYRHCNPLSLINALNQ